MSNSLKNKFKYSALAALIVTLLSCTVMAFTGFGAGVGANTANAETASSQDSGISAYSAAQLAVDWNNAVSQSIQTGAQKTFKLTDDWTAQSDAGFTTSFGMGEGFYSGRICVPEGANILLDLNGHTIDRALGSPETYINDGSVFLIGGTLEITDTSTNHDGKITGGRTTGSGGGLCLYGDAYVTLTNGYITANKAQTVGAGVYVKDDCTFIMNGGYITANDCRSGSHGGGGIGILDDASTVIMNGGEISTNNSIHNGGGVFMYKGTFIMNGGTITSNTTTMSGGAIYSYLYGNLTIYDGVLTNNRGGSTTYGGTGGGLYSNGTVTIYGGTISDNTSRTRGGGISFGGGSHVTIYDVVISNNTADDNGGGIYTGNNSVCIKGGVISGNTANTCGGGLYLDSGTVFTMEGGTISGNSSTTSDSGGGVFVAEDATFMLSGGTIGGTRSAEANIGGSGGGVYVRGGNLIMTAGTITGNSVDGAKNGSGVCVTEGGTFTMDGGTISNNNDATTGGGVYVSTADSKFIMNGGTITGNKASYGAGVNISEAVFELCNGSIINNTASSETGGLRIADSGTATMTGGTISGNTGKLYGGVMTYTSATFTMKAGTITDNMSGGNAGGILVGPNSSATIEGGTISGNVSGSGGGGIYAGGPLILTGGEIFGNTAMYRGGGVYVNSAASLDYTGGEVFDNTATGGVGDDFGFEIYTNPTRWNWVIAFSQKYPQYQIGALLGASWTADEDSTYTTSFGTGVGFSNGRFFIPEDANIALGLNGRTLSRGLSTSNIIDDGGIFYVKGALEIIDNATGGTITGGATTGCGGGIYIDGGSLTLTSGSISNNYSKLSSGGGGGVYVIDGTFIMNGGTISDNYSQATTVGGGGVLLKNSSFIMNGGTLSGNRSAHGGGGVYLYSSSSFEMNGGTITGGNSTTSGGGVSIQSSIFTMNGGTISNNNGGSSTWGGDGGGVAVGGDSSFIMTGGTITGNTSPTTGAGVHVNPDATFTMDGGTISGNSATGNGGGVRVRGTFYFNGGEITENTSGGYGGGLYLDGVKVVMSGGEVSNNTSTNSGVGLYLSSGSFTMTGGKITNNEHVGGSCIYMASGTFTLDGGEISNNSATPFSLQSGASLEMNSGSIMNNTAPGNGGVLVYGTFTMNGGTISNNSAYSGMSGGVYINNSGTFTMNGGTIIGNTAATLGGGVYVGSGTFNLSGGIISGNNANGYANNVYFISSAIINIAGNLSTDGTLSRIGVTLASGHSGTFTSDFKTYNPSAVPATYFFSDNTGYSIGANSSGEGIIQISTTVPTSVQWQYSVDGNTWINIDSPYATVNFANTAIQVRVLDHSGNCTIVSSSNGSNTIQNVGRYALVMPNPNYSTISNPTLTLEILPVEIVWQYSYDNATWFNFTQDTYSYAGVEWFVRAYDGVNGVAVTLSTSPSSTVKASGTYTYAASNTNENYTNDTFSFTIVKKTLTVNWNFDGWLKSGNDYYVIYDGLAHAPVPSVSDAENPQWNTIHFNYSVELRGLTFVAAQAAAGDYVITVSVEDPDIILENVTTAYKISPKLVKVNWVGSQFGEYNFEYDPAGHAVEAELSGILPQDSQSFSVTYYNNGKIISGLPTAVGTYTAVATLPANCYNYYFNDTQSVTINVVSKSLTVIWSGNADRNGEYVWTFGGSGKAYAPHAEVYDVLGNSVAIYAEYATYINGVAGTYTSTVPTDAGNYIMRVKLSTTGYNGDEYVFNNPTKVFEIEQLGVYVEWSYDTNGELVNGVVRWEYDGQAHNLTATVTAPVVKDGGDSPNLSLVRTDNNGALTNVDFATAVIALDPNDSYNKNFYIVNSEDCSLSYEVYKRVLTSASFTDKIGNTYALGVTASYNFGTVTGLNGPNYTAVAEGLDGDLALTVTYSASFTAEWTANFTYYAYAQLSADDFKNYCFEDGTDTATLSFFIREIGQIPSIVPVTWVYFTNDNEYKTLDELGTDKFELTYNGKVQYPEAIYVRDDGTFERLTISFSNAGVNVGYYSVRLVGTDEYSYEGDLDCEYEIIPMEVSINWQNSSTDQGTTFVYYFNNSEQAPYASANVSLPCPVTVKGEVNAGSYKATAVVGDNFTIVSGETQDYKIEKIAINVDNIVWSAPDAIEQTENGETYFVYVYDGDVHAPEATYVTSFGITLTFTIQGKDSEVGTHYAVAVLDGGNKEHANFTLGDASMRFDVVQVSVSTVYWKDADGNVSDGSKTLSFVYNGSEQAPLAYFIDDDGKEISLKVLGAMTNAGTYKAYVDSEFDFGGIIPECPFVITAKSLNVTWTDTTVTFNGQDQSPVAAVVDADLKYTLVEGKDYTVSAFKNANTYTAQIIFLNKNYTAGSGSTTSFTIEKIDLASFATWSFAEGDLNANGVFTVPYSASAVAPKVDVTLNGLNIKFTFDYTGVVETVGTHKVTATVKTATLNGKDIGASNFTLGSNGSMDYEVTPFEISVTWRYANVDGTENGVHFWYYNGDERAPVAVYLDWNNHEQTLEVDGKQVNANANPYTAKVYAPANCVFADGTLTTAQFLIKQATIIVEWSADDKATLIDGVYVWTYDGDAHAPVATIKGTSNELGVTGSATDASSTNYVATAAQSDGNYVIASGETQEFRIVPQTVYVLWIGADGTDDDSDDNFKWAYTGALRGPTAFLVDADKEFILDADGNPIEVEVSNLASAVGTHTAVATDTFTNYDFSTSEQEFEITARELVAFEWLKGDGEIDDDGRYVYSYTGNNLRPDPTSEYGDAVSFDVKIYAVNSNGSLGMEVSDIINAGTYRVIATSLNKNFSVPEDSATIDVVVNPYKAEVIWSTDDLIYNGSNQAPSAYYVDANGNTVKLDVTVTTANHKDAAEYTATASFTTTTANYVLDEDSKTTTYEIKAYELKVEWTGNDDGTFEWTYDGDEHAPVNTVSADVDLSGLTVTSEIQDKDGNPVGDSVKDAGTYKIVLKLSGTGAGNYTFDDGEKVFVINKAKLTITVKDVTIKYGDPAPSYEAEITGFISDEEEEELLDLISGKKWLNCTYVKGNVPGTYEIGVITQTLAELLPNYEIPENVTGTLTVDAIPFTVVWLGQLPDATAYYSGNEFRPSAYYVNDVSGEPILLNNIIYTDDNGDPLADGFKAVDAGTYYVKVIVPDGLTLNNTLFCYQIRPLEITVNIASQTDVFGTIYKDADGVIQNATLEYTLGDGISLDDFADFVLTLTLVCNDRDFDAYGYLKVGSYKIVGSWKADKMSNYKVTFVGEAEDDVTGENTCGLYTVDEAEIQVTKQKEEDNFEEIIPIVDGTNVFISLDEIKDGEYRFIKFAGSSQAEVTITYSKPHDINNVPDPADDDLSQPTGELMGAGEYAINYKIEIANHKVYYGTWNVYVVPSDSLIKITLDANKFFEVSYGDGVPENLAQQLVDGGYITSIAGYTTTNFVKFAQITIVDEFGEAIDEYSGVGSYTITVKIVDGSSLYRRVVQFTDDLNENRFVINPKVLTVDWGNVNFTQDTENPDKVWIDELAITVSGWVNADALTLEDIKVSANGAYEYTVYAVDDNGETVKITLTATGDFKTVGAHTLLLTVENENYVINSENAAVSVTINAPELTPDPEQPEKPAEIVEGGAPGWLWGIIAGLGLLLLILIIVIVALSKRRTVVAGGDDDGFYDDATGDE